MCVCVPETQRVHVSQRFDRCRAGLGEVFAHAASFLPVPSNGASHDGVLEHTAAFLGLKIIYIFMNFMYKIEAPQRGAADAEIKVPSGENTELKRSPFKAWSRSVYSHICYAYCQEFHSFLLISTPPVHSPALFPKPLPIFPCVGCG